MSDDSSQSSDSFNFKERNKVLQGNIKTVKEYINASPHEVDTRKSPIKMLKKRKIRLNRYDKSKNNSISTLLHSISEREKQADASYTRFAAGKKLISTFHEVQNYSTCSSSGTSQVGESLVVKADIEHVPNPNNLVGHLNEINAEPKHQEAENHAKENEPKNIVTARRRSLLVKLTQNDFAPIKQKPKPYTYRKQKTRTCNILVEWKKMYEEQELRKGNRSKNEQMEVTLGEMVRKLDSVSTHITYIQKHFS